MSAWRPELRDRRQIALMRAAVARCRLDLRGLTVLTEAASGAYVVTPVLAAMAGARRVFAVTRGSQYGSVEDIRRITMDLATAAGVADRIEIVTSPARDIAPVADIVTNSGHVRPIDARFISALKPGAVVALMYEGWEFRPSDVDLDACRRAEIAVTATNETHPQIDVFSYLGVMALKLLIDAGIGVSRSSILLLCDNPFRPYLERGLRAAGAQVEVSDRLGLARGGTFDAIVLAMTPGAAPALQAADAARIACEWPDAVVAQFWGDVDRTAFATAGVPVWPPDAPKPGHMGILPSDLGPEPIIRLQSGGLKSAEMLWRYRAGEDNIDLNYVQLLDGSPMPPRRGSFDDCGQTSVDHGRSGSDWVAHRRPTGGPSAV